MTSLTITSQVSVAPIGSTAAEYQLWTVNTIKDELIRRQLSYTGATRKADLIECLTCHDQGRQWIRPSERLMSSTPDALSRPSSASVAPCSSAHQSFDSRHYANSQDSAHTLYPYRGTLQQEPCLTPIRPPYHNLPSMSQPPQYGQSPQLWAQPPQHWQQQPPQSSPLTSIHPGVDMSQWMLTAHTSQTITQPPNVPTYTPAILRSPRTVAVQPGRDRTAGADNTLSTSMAGTTGASTQASGFSMAQSQEIDTTSDDGGVPLLPAGGSSSTEDKENAIEPRAYTEEELDNMSEAELEVAMAATRQAMAKDKKRKRKEKPTSPLAQGGSGETAAATAATATLTQTHAVIATSIREVNMRETTPANLPSAAPPPATPVSFTPQVPQAMPPRMQRYQDPFLHMLDMHATVDSRFDYLWEVVDRNCATNEDINEFRYHLGELNNSRARHGLEPLWQPEGSPGRNQRGGSYRFDIDPYSRHYHDLLLTRGSMAPKGSDTSVKRRRVDLIPPESLMTPPASSPASYELRQATANMSVVTPKPRVQQQQWPYDFAQQLPLTPTPFAASTTAMPPPENLPFAHKMMAKMGFVPGQGLGPEGTGISKPIEAVKREAKVGLGVPLTEEPVLSEEQAALVNLICDRRNVFYTGSAGTGKSTILKAFVKRMRDDMKLQVDIIAPTGRAALDVNGSTFWTYAGWTPNNLKKPIEELENDAWFQKFVRKRLQKTNVLVFDEISMVENSNFERLNRILKAARKSSMPFGGVQLVVTGDFCQLPPVKPFQYCMECGKEMIRSLNPTMHKCHTHGTIPDTDKWAFKSHAWREANFQHVELTKIHRQSDETFIRILQKLRIGDELTQDDRDLLLDHPCQVTEHNAVRLFPTLAEVKRINDEAFAKLKPMPRRFTCLDDATIYNHHPHLKMKAQRLPDGSLSALREHRLEAAVDYKLGMRVVLLANLDLNAGLVNGSQGTIIKWERHADKNLPKAWENISKEMRSKYPSFGGDDDGSPVKGKSKPTFPANTSGTLPPILSGDYAAHREAQIKSFIQSQAHQEWPIVQFKTPKGVITRTIYADCRVNELGDEKPYSHLSRTQIPLVAAWAMTIHKSQGMTLDKVVVDLSRSFEEGQEYVALSRARALEGLKVEGLGVGGEGNREVREFLEGHFGRKV